MAREDAQESRLGGEQAHNQGYGKRLQARHDRQNPAPYGKEGEERPEEYEKRIDSYAEAVLYFLDHPDAPLNPVVRAFIESMRTEIESGRPTSARQITLN